MSQILSSGASGGGGGTLLTLSGSAGGLVSPGGTGNIGLIDGTNITTTGIPGAHTIGFALVNSPTCSGTITGATLRTGDPAVLAAATSITTNTISAVGTGAAVALNLASKGNADINFTAATGYGMVFDGVTTGWASSQYHTIQKTVQTTNGTPTVIHSIPLANSLMITVKAIINGIQDDFTDVVGGEVLVTCYRDAIGDIKLVGSPIINSSFSNPVDTSDLDVAINVGTQSLELLVVGVGDGGAIPNQNWNWAGTISFMQTISNA